jgi:hypothetical protein
LCIINDTFAKISTVPVFDPKTCICHLWHRYIRRLFVTYPPDIGLAKSKKRYEKFGEGIDQGSIIDRHAMVRYHIVDNYHKSH